MTLGSLLYATVQKGRRILGIDRTLPVEGQDGTTREEALAYPGLQDNPLGRIFLDHDGRIVHKWLHFFDIYHQHLARYRDTSFRMLEIGVFNGGSLEMWRKYFGADFTLFGVDIDPRCAALVDPPNQVRIGSQDDPEFLRKVVAEMGGIDVVLDDGSHVAGHQKTSFETLFPLLSEGGLYIIEDLHTAYYPRDFDGGYRRPGSGIEQMKDVVDDMHHWYHGRKFRTIAGGDVAAVHFYDSIAIIEKRKARPPLNTMIGKP